MEELKSVILKLLETDEKCRENNEYLYLKVYEYYGLPTDLKEIAKLSYKEKVSMESIRRWSCKLRSMYHHLQPRKQIQVLRNKLQEEYKNINNYVPSKTEYDELKFI